MANKGQTGLDLMRVPFEPNQIGRLPKPTRDQTNAVRDDFKKGVRCKECGGWHHPDVVHLDYVGHAALTDRMLQCDPHWNWEPFSRDETGLPRFDSIGGLWINLTVCGVTRPGYGHPDGKQGGNAIKEAIGDALRNAAMRFGAALDLWHKGDLHAVQEEIDAHEKPRCNVEKWVGNLSKTAVDKAVKAFCHAASKGGDIEQLKKDYSDELAQLKANAPGEWARDRIKSVKEAINAASKSKNEANQIEGRFDEMMDEIMDLTNRDDLTRYMEENSGEMVAMPGELADKLFNKINERMEKFNG